MHLTPYNEGQKYCGISLIFSNDLQRLLGDQWDHFDILAKGKTDYHCKIKETFFIQELEPAFNVNVGSEKLMLY